MREFLPRFSRTLRRPAFPAVPALLLLPLLLALLPAAAPAEEDAASCLVRFSYDLPGEYTMTASGASGVSAVGKSRGFGAEFFTAGGAMEAGAGVEYQKSRTGSGEAHSFRFLPVYAVIRLFPLVTDEGGRNTGLFFTGRIGYAALHGGGFRDSAVTDARGGVYYGFGTGSILRDGVQLDALYSVSTASAVLPSGEKAAAAYAKTELSVGVRF